MTRVAMLGEALVHADSEHETDKFGLSHVRSSSGRAPC